MRHRPSGIPLIPGTHTQVPFPGTPAQDAVPWYPDVDFALAGDWAGMPNPKVYSSRLERLLQRCMEVQPARRPALAEVSAEIENALVALERRFPGLGETGSEGLPGFMRVVGGEEEYRFYPPARKFRFGGEG